MSFSTVVIRLGLSILLSGLIGMERQNKNRPAGFRTHILVCVGAALTMMVSENMAMSYGDFSRIDPTRLGAQVISGIGFLGAGTIIRDGVTVKGLTTAASLWAIACIGLAVGAGFYTGAIVGSAMIYFILFFLGRFGGFLNNQSLNLTLNLIIDNTPGKVGEIGVLLGQYKVNIISIEFLQLDDDSNEAHIKLILRLPHGLTHDFIINEVLAIEGVHSAEE